MGAMPGSRPVRIHVSWTAVSVPLMLAFCVTPLATAGGAWILLYLAPALALVVVIFAGTTATATHLSARWLRGRTRIDWADLAQIEFPGQRWAVAVTTSGRRTVLPGVRPIDLPRIVAAAGSRLFLLRPPTDVGPGTDEADGSDPDADGSGDERSASGDDPSTQQVRSS